MHARIADRRMAVEKARREEIYRLLGRMLDHLAAATQAGGGYEELDLTRHRRLLARLSQSDEVSLATLTRIAAELSVSYQRLVDGMLKARARVVR